MGGKRVRITQTDMKDARFVTEALSGMGLDYRTEAEVVFVETNTSKATINLKTGAVRCDPDLAPVLRQLRQRYAEAKVRAEAVREGVEIRGRFVDPKTGAIILKCRMTTPQ